MLIVALLFFQVIPPADEWVRIPGRIEVAYRDTVTPPQQKVTETSLGLPVQAGPYRTRMQGNKVTGRSFRYDVAVGSELFWVATLREHPLVSSAEWPKVEGVTTSVQIFVQADREKRKLPSEAISSPPSTPLFCLPVRSTGGGLTCSSDTNVLLRHLNTSDVGSMLQSYFAYVFNEKRAEVRILENADNFLKLKIGRLRGEVIRDHRYWEQIEIYAVFFPVADGIKIHFLLDGKYAAGMGINPPADVGFTSMEQEYYKQESDYLHELGNTIRESLRTGIMK